MDITVLTRNIEDLQAHFKNLQNLSPRTLKVWCVYLSESLSEEELERAVDQALINYGCNHDLSAKELVELAKGTDKSLVLECWTKALEAASLRRNLSELDDASQYAIAQLGGCSHLGYLQIKDLHSLKFDFCEHWRSYRREPKEFRKASLEWTENQLPEVKPEEDRQPIAPEIKQLFAETRAKLKSSVSRQSGRSLLKRIAEATNTQPTEFSSLGSLLPEMPKAEAESKSLYQMNLTEANQMLCDPILRTHAIAWAKAQGYVYDGQEIYQPN